MRKLSLHPPELQAVVDAAQSFDYGDIITLEWLQQHFELVPPTTGPFDDFKTYQLQFLSAMDRFRTLMLEEHKKALKSERGIGYRVVLPKEQTSFAMERWKDRVRKECDKAMASLANIRGDMLNEDQQQQNLDARAKVSMLRSFNKDAKVGFDLKPQLPGNDDENDE